MPRGKEFRGGQYGNTRGKERQKRRAESRAQDPRYRAAMEATRKAQDELDSLMAEQQQNPAMGAVEGAMYVARQKEAQAKLEAAQAAEKFEAEAASEVVKLPPRPKKFSTKGLPIEGDGNFPFAVTMAKKMLKEGYHIKYTLEFTGVGLEDVEGIELDYEGFGVREEEEEDAEVDNSSLG